MTYKYYFDKLGTVTIFIKGNVNQPKAGNVAVKEKQVIAREIGPSAANKDAIFDISPNRLN
ncbi:MAG TPA: hypothetical protein VMW66_04600 [Elusimicrobiales bacterium]|nr:hypothetical protein [Elusimicrobiales bacterium]